jgi:hypothetical protein
MAEKIEVRNGRKYRMGLIALLAITGAFGASAMGGVPAALLATFIGGILGVYGAYCTGNVGGKYVTTRPGAQAPVMED